MIDDAAREWLREEIRRRVNVLDFNRDKEARWAMLNAIEEARQAAPAEIDVEITPTPEYWLVLAHARDRICISPVNLGPRWTSLQSLCSSRAAPGSLYCRRRHPKRDIAFAVTAALSARHAMILDHG